MLRIQQLSKTFYPNTVNEKRIFDSLNLTVLDGEFVTIIGSNGAGKSSLLNLISGSISADSGTIFLNQEDLTHTVEYERTRFISRVFQNPTMGTSPSMTIAQNLSLAKNKSGIRVNAVAQGPIWTPLIPSSFEKSEIPQFGSTTALGRAGQMVECTGSYVFLASEVASYITGQTIHINGGEMVTSKLKISHLVVKKFNDLFFYKGLLKK